MVLNITLALAAFLNLSLSIFVLFQDYKSVNNRFFSLFSFIAALWTLTNFMTGIQPLPFWLESTYASGALVIGTGIAWILVVLEKKLDKKSLLIIFLAVVFAGLSYVPGFIAEDYDQIYAGGVFTGEPGLGLIVYTVVFLCGAGFILWRLLHVRKMTEDVQKKSQLMSIFYGTLFLVIISAFTSFILPALSFFSFGGLDSIGLLLFLFFIAYAITKQHLFNIKVVTTELITFSLWVFILVRALLAEEREEMLVGLGLLVVTIIVGILLIRSVLQEVRQREKIEVLAKDLSETNERQEKLIHFIGHEVKGYLTKGEYAFSEMVDGDFGSLPQESKVLASTALNELRKGVASVTDILKAANLKRGTVTYDLKPVDFKDMLKEEVIKTKALADEKGLAFEVSINEGQAYTVNLDRGQFGEHVIRNLIDNAIKYTPKGSITIRLARAGDKALFSVKDSGVGITDEDRTRLFTEGGRGKDSMKVNVHSTGYGLYIAKGIVEAHGGRIWVESEGANKGSTFFVELPLVNPATV